MSATEIRSTTGTAPIKFDWSDTPGRHVTIELEDGSSQVYDAAELRRLLDAGIRRIRGASDVSDSPTQYLRDLIADLMEGDCSGIASVDELHTALLVLEYRIGLPLTRPGGES